MKRKIGYILPILLCLSLSACGTGNGLKDKMENSSADAAANKTEAAVEVEDETRLYVIYNKEEKGQSYGLEFSKGVKSAAEELGILVTELEGNTDQELETAVGSACENGADMILAASAEAGEYIRKYGELYPEIRFTVLDVEIGLPNVQSVYTEKKESFFVAGAAAALFTEEKDVEGVNEASVIGWIGGMNIPVVQEYFKAFEQGARSINPEVVILEEYVGSWDDVEKAKDVILSQAEQKADIVMTVASKAGAGVLEGAQEQGVYLMEIEAEMSGLNGGSDLEPHTAATESNAEMSKGGKVAASLIEKPEQAGKILVKTLADDGFSGGKDLYLTLKEGTVEFCANTDSNGDYFISEEIRTQCKEIVEKIQSGEIVIGNP